MPLVPGRPRQPSFEDSFDRNESITQSERVTAYYEALDESDSANWPTDDETKTIPPFHTMIVESTDSRQPAVDMKENEEHGN